MRTNDDAPSQPSDAPETAPRDRGRLVGAAAIPGIAVMAASFVQTEILHGSWDRLNAIFVVWNPTRSNVNDALPALEAARALLASHHAAIYDMSQTDRAAFLYPPIAAAIYVPHLAEGEGALWSLVAFDRLVFLLTAMLVAAALVGRKRRWPTIGEALGVAAAMVLFLPMVRSLELNQASLYVAFCVGAAWVALDRGAESAAGVFLALAGAFKPHLFAIAPLLVFHARRTAIAAGIAGAGLLAASIAYAGIDNHVTYVTHVLPEAARGYAFFPNQSFGGLLHRLFFRGPIDSFELMERDPRVLGLASAIGLALYAGAALVAFKARARRDAKMEVLAMAWLVTTMIAPIAWGHHYAAALFPLAWMVGRARDGEVRDLGRLRLLITGCALVGSYFVVGGLSGAGPRLLSSYGLFGALLATAAFVKGLAPQGSAAGAVIEEAGAPSDPAPSSFPAGDRSGGGAPSSARGAPSP